MRSISIKSLGLILFFFSSQVFATQFQAGDYKVSVPDVRAGGYEYQVNGKNYVHSGKVLLKKASWVDAARKELKPGEKQAWLIQFKTMILPDYKVQLEKSGIKVIRYVPDHAYLVSANQEQIELVNNRVYIKDIYQYSAPYKMSQLPQSLWLGPVNRQIHTFDILPISKIQKYELIGKIREAGLKLLQSDENQFAIRVEANVEDIQKVAQWGQTLWIELAPEKIELDMDIVLITGGAQALIQSTGNYQGEGIRGHVFEGIYSTHQDFKADEFRDMPIAVGNPQSAAHGHSTFGIIYGSGAGDPSARGLIPRAQGYYTHYNEVYNNDSRLEFTRQLIADHEIMLQTASWGYPTTTEYGARSLEMDEIIFELDLPITQSQSNRSSKSSRPQAWAKNIISVGAVHHRNNTDFSDDSWSAGGASIGPASDGRIKPDIISYYDGIHTTGSNGYTTFGGTSGATPIINGHLGIILEMFTDGIFGNALEYPVEERFLNRPHSSTAKALLINSAKQYDFQGESHDLTRVHQGWGHPSLDRLYDRRDQIMIVDEDDQLQALESKAYQVSVVDGQPQFAATLVYNDPPGTLGAEFHRVNDLDLIVVSPDGTRYLGNNGLRVQPESLAGGQKDSLNTVENVFVNNPIAGTWTVEVVAAEINQDGHVETTELDSDFALVVSGIDR